ncbi:hypothetical protein Trydic_g9283 [Trypoxylus dichotomus]
MSDPTVRHSPSYRNFHAKSQLLREVLNSEAAKIKDTSSRATVRGREIKGSSHRDQCASRRKSNTGE